MKIKNIILSNAGLKVTALLLAFLVWVMIAGKEHMYSEQTVEVNVEYFNAAETIDVSSVRPDKVRLTLRGTSKELQKVSPEDYKIKFDLKGITESTRLNYFTEDHLQYPKAMKPVAIYPRMIEITVREFMTREVDIRVRYKGDLKPGIILVSRRLEPDKVKIFGYKSQVASIEEVEAAEWVDLGDLLDSRVISIPLKKSKDILKFEDTESVDVHIIIEKRNEPKPGTNTKTKAKEQEKEKGNDR
jgi:YbbR domain-containing protein